MSKKDIILVAVLVNMVLLVFLFLGAIKTPQAVEVAKDSTELPPMHAELSPSTSAIDQVDHLLSQYMATQENAPKEPELPSLVNVEPPSVNSCSELGEFRIQAGDTLDSLARQHKTSVAEIRRLNQLQEDTLYPGQIVYLPKIQTSILDEEPPATQAKSAKYYIVKAGDNPWTIAKKNNIKVSDLLRINGLNEQKATKLQPGDRLRIE